MVEPRGTGWTQHWTGYGPFEPFQTTYYPILPHAEAPTESKICVPRNGIKHHHGGKTPVEHEVTSIIFPKFELKIFIPGGVGCWCGLGRG